MATFFDGQKRFTHSTAQLYALEVYARQALNREAEDRCRQIRERAERECGKRLKQRAPPRRGRNSSTSSDVTLKNPTLEQLGITRNQSSEWQRLADASDEEFEAAVAENRVIALKRPSRDGRLEPIDDDILWLRWTDFDLDAPRDRPFYVRRLKGSKDRIHTLEPDTAQALKRMKPTSDGVYVFRSERGAVIARHCPGDLRARRTPGKFRFSSAPAHAAPCDRLCAG